MKFNYPNEGVKTVEAALLSGLTSTVQGSGPRVFDPSYIKGKADQILDEIRVILTGELATLLDDQGVAAEWNEAVELAIRVVEGTAP